jgi:hypothetical protein
MTLLTRTLHLWRNTVRVVTLVILLSAVGLVVTQAQNKSAPYSLFQYATLSGSDNTITATRVPVVTSAGTAIYKNITLQFDVDSDGNVTLSSGYPQVVDAPALLVSSFAAGNYIGPSSLLNGKTPVIVNGPGASDGGATAWSLTTAPGADGCTYPSSATWYVGPIASNPVAARVQKVGITSSAWSYGIAGGVAGPTSCTTASRFWRAGTLIGVTQTGNALTIASFTDGFQSGIDSSAPLDQITYRLVQ